MTGICKESLNCGLIQEDLCCGECSKLKSCESVCSFIQDPFVNFDFNECKYFAENITKSGAEFTNNEDVS